VTGALEGFPTMNPGGATDGGARLDTAVSLGPLSWSDPGTREPVC